MRWALPVFLLSGCGRLAFDPTSDGGGGGDGGDAIDDGPSLDAPTGHDEDKDGFPDVTDFCPHLPSIVNLDDDGDGVGNTCDPEPALPNQRWIAFSPMIGDDNVIDAAGTMWSMGADSWDFADDVNPQNLIRTDPVDNVDIWVGEDITTTTGGSGRQLAIIIRENNNNPYYYGEIYDAGAGAQLHIEHYDGANYNALTSTTFTGGFPMNQSLDLHLQARTSPPTFTFAADAQSTSTATSSYIGGTMILIATGNCSGSIRYVAIIGS
jgi:hypothetical protein